MKDIVRKITSRKFVLTVVIVVAGLATAFKAVDNEKVQIAGCVMAAVATIVYSIVEGTVDKASVADTTIDCIEAIEAIKEIEGDEKENDES